MSYGVHLEGGLSSCYVLKRLVLGLVATIGFDDRVFVGGLRIEMSIDIAFKNFGKLVLRAQLRHGVHFEGGKSSCYGLEHSVIGLDDAMGKRLVTGNVCCHRETSTLFSQLNVVCKVCSTATVTSVTGGAARRARRRGARLAARLTKRSQNSTKSLVVSAK